MKVDHNSAEYSEKPLNFTLKEFQRRGNTLANLIIDKYIIYSKIGYGTFGEVYRGMNEETKLRVAVKIINLKVIKEEPTPKIK